MKPFECIESDINKYFGSEGTAYYLVGFKDGRAVDIDGSHELIEGVVKAKKLIGKIFPNKDVDFWAMITVSRVPDWDVEINEEAAQQCADMVKRYETRRTI